MLPITKRILTSTRNRPALRDAKWYAIRKLKGIVIHWTANTAKGADAIRNRNYFNTTDRWASAHYIVDDHSIVQCLPDYEVGYHVGGRTYKPIGEEIREDNLTPNYFLIGIEMCVNEDGDWDKTYQYSVELTQFLLNKYNFTIKNLYRHYDITGKLCPMMMIDEKPWQAFRDAVNRGLAFQLEDPIKRGVVNTPELNVRKGNGIQYAIVDEYTEGTTLEIFEELGNWYRVGDERWLHKHYVKITFTQKTGIVEDPTGLNVRTGPSSKHDKVDVLEDGSQIIITNQEGKWYQIGNNRWVFASYVRLLEVKNGRVTAPYYLNVRTGPGTNNRRIRQIPRDMLVKVYEEDGRWYRIGEGEWVFGIYIDLLDEVA
ncbi:MAG: SH3 domain-containing protein [Saprospiraceae bacterium]